MYVSAYAEAVSAAGGLPVHLPQHVDPAEYAGRLDGLLLSGGADIDPARFDATPSGDAGPVEPGRDAAELGLVELAVAEDLPVLGICRGLQLLNVWAGGTLHQHVPSHARYDLPADDHFDEVTVNPTSRIGLMYGRRDASTRCTTRPSTASPTAGSSRPAAATARSRPSSGRATTSSPCSGTPSCSRAGDRPVVRMARRPGPRRAHAAAV